MTTAAAPTITPVIADLNAQWARLIDGSESPYDVAELLAQVRAERAYAGTRPSDLDDILALIHDDPDARLAALIRLGQTGSSMAVRVVVQAYLGRVVNLACRFAAGRDLEHQISVGVATLWDLVVSYPLARRPRVAANIAMDVLKHMDRPNPHELPAGDLRDDLSSEADESAEVVDFIDRYGPAAEILDRAVAGGYLTTENAALLTGIYLARTPYAALAEQAGTSQAALRQRASRAVANLRKHADALDRRAGE